MFALAAGLLASGLALGSLLAVDIYLHARFQKSAGLNIWGYRGDVLPKKAPGELRLAFLGGSTAFGYGVTADEATPARLEQKLRARRAAAGQGPVSVANLGYNNEGVYSYTFTLRDYAYLNYDLAIFYQGYNDLGDAPNVQVYRHDSPIFRLTGYLPIFPVAFKEKAASIRYGGDISAAYRAEGDNRTVFRPGLARMVAAGALNATATVAESLGRMGSMPPGQPEKDPAPSPEGCTPRWSIFCRSIFTAIDLALSNGTRVLVVTQPYLTGRDEAANKDQQASLMAALSARYGGNSRVKHVNLGNEIRLDDRALSYDGMHLSAAGNDIIAERLIDPVLSLASGN